MTGATPGALLPLVPIVTVLAGAVCYPALVLAWYGVSRDAWPSLANLAAVLADRDTWRVFGNTLWVATWTTGLAGGLGTALALLVGRTDLPGRSMFQGLLVLPYLVPPFIGAMAVLYVLGPTGLLNQAWMALSGDAEPLVGIYGSGGIVLAMTLYKYPIAYLAVLAGLGRVDPALEEAARSAGAGPWRTVRDVTLPLVAPSVAAGMTLVFLSAMAEFGTPAILGFPAKYFVLATKIYATVLDFDRPYNLHLAAALSLLLAVLAGLVLALQRWWFGERGFAVAGAPGRGPVVPLGRARRWAAGAVAGFLLLTSALPLAAVVLTALTRAYGRPLGVDNLGLENFRLVLFQLPGRVAGGAEQPAPRRVGRDHLRRAGAGRRVSPRAPADPRRWPPRDPGDAALRGAGHGPGPRHRARLPQAGPRAPPLQHAVDHLDRLRGALPGAGPPAGRGGAGPAPPVAGGGGAGLGRLPLAQLSPTSRCRCSARGSWPPGCWPRSPRSPS